MKKVLKKIFLILGIVVLTGILAAGLVFYFKYGRGLLAMQKDAKSIINASSRATFKSDQTSLLYDASGNLIAEIKGAKDSYYLDIKDIPAMAIEAIIAIEDKKFYRHGGIDYKAVARAMKAYIEEEGEITQGGSTITQQLARTIFLTNEKTWERKIKEAFMALEIEKKYSKADIMEFYLNNIYFANGFYGIESAAKGYFGRSVNDLTLSELCFILAIPNNPSMYAPYQNFDDTIARRDRILYQMILDGRIGEKEYKEALDEEIVLVKKKQKKNDYIETYAYRCATHAIMEHEGFVFRYIFEDSEDRARYEENYNNWYTRCQRKLFTGGLRIYTSFDMSMQKKLQKAVDKGLESSKEKNDEGVYALQGSAVTIDNSTGRVVAIVGGRSQKFAGYTLNRAFQSFRQPGSSIKPLIVYTPAFENGYYPEDKVEDKKRKDGPSNVDFAYAGTTTIEYAVTVSKNTVAWDLFNEIGPEWGLRYLISMDFSRITRDDYYPSAALGGLYRGVSALEMTAAYSALENEGAYREPTCIVRITDANGREIVSDRIKTRQVYDPEATRKMTYCLTKVMEKGTGKNGKLDNISCAGKTGTTNDNKDQWFVGFTGYYTTGIWVGYDMPKNMDDLPSETEPVRIWKGFMEKIHKDKEDVPFPDYIKKPKEEKETDEDKEKEEEEEIEEEEPEIKEQEDVNEPAENDDEYNKEDESLEEPDDDGFGEDDEDPVDETEGEPENEDPNDEGIDDTNETDDDYDVNEDDFYE